MSLKPGTLLGPYEVLSLIGAGGMGEVYKGRDTRLDRFVALKTLPAHLADRPELRERFKREASTLANLKHAHICTLYDIGSQELEAEEAKEAKEAEEAKEAKEAKERQGLRPAGLPGMESRGGRRSVRIDFLVMEYLEGETLAERLKKGPLPLEQVLQYAGEISDALDTAHRQGFIHRDIKPGNLMLTKAGSKILDFGLAKLKQEVAKATIPASEMPTAPGTLTQHGTLLGTLQYMAPEQVEGRTDDLDGRTDVFGFGAVVYEMVTGKKAFDGKNQASVIAKVLEHNPPAMSSLKPMTPPALDRVVKKCLAKEPEKRWQAASDLHDELQWIQEAGQAGMPAPLAKPAAKVWKRRLAFSVAGLLAWAVTALVIWNLRPALPAPLVSRLTISLPPGQRLAALDQPALAISPDGKNLVYVAVQSRDREGAGVPSRDPSASLRAGREGAGVRVPPVGQPPLADARGSDAVQQLYLRPLDSLESKPIAGTEGAVGPFFSPDGQWVGFFAGGKLKKVSVNGGAAVTLASVSTPGGASWSSQGILGLQRTVGASTGLQQISQEGGTPQPLTRVGSGDPNHGWPEFLPGGKSLLFTHSPTFAAWNNAQIAVQPAGTSEQKDLAQGTQPRYAATGHLLFAQGGMLMAAPFDARRLTLTGSPVPALEGVMQSNFTGAAQYSLSSTGILVYLAGGFAPSESRLVWVSRNGEEQLLPAAPHNYQFPRLSPDGRRVAVAIAEQEQQIWVYDTSRDTLTRLTFGGIINNTPVWSPDGKRIAVASNRAAAPLNLFWQPSDGSGAAERLTTSDYLNAPTSFSPDGQLLAFQDNKPETGRDIWVLNLKDRKAQPFLKTPNEDTAARFSPDGKWLAYSSDESGRREIYVQPYPGPGGKWQISTDGGQEPVWNPNGRELFYRSGSKIMAVDVEGIRAATPSASSGQAVSERPSGGAGVSPAPSSFSAGKPRMLFEGPYLLTTASFAYYDVSPDGQRFLMLKPVETQTSAPTQINVVLNWFEELKRRVPAGR